MNVGSTAKRVEGIRRAKRLARDQSCCPRGGRHDWGFKIVTRNGKRIRVPNPTERGLMRYCLKPRLANATLRQICDEVEERTAKCEGRKKRSYGFQAFTINMCRAAIAKEVKLQAQMERGRRFVAYLHATGLTGVPADQCQELDRFLMQLDLNGRTLAEAMQLIVEAETQKRAT